MAPALTLLLLLACAVAGLAAGVGINALADRVTGVDDPPWNPRQCRGCLAPLPPAAVPGVRELWRPRTCAACGRRASLRRPLLELALAVLFPALLLHALAPGGAVRLPWGVVLAVDLLALCALAFIFVVDLEHRLIYDLSIYPLAGLALALALAFDRKALAGMLFGVLVCGGLFLLFYGLGFLVYHQEALGFGDVKLAALIGLLAGWPGTATALVAAAVLGAGGSVLLLGLSTATRRTYIPFGIFLSLGAALALVAARPVW